MSHEVQLVPFTLRARCMHCRTSCSMIRFVRKTHLCFLFKFARNIQYFRGISSTCRCHTNHLCTPDQTGFSYSHGASSVPLLGSTMSKLIDQVADRYGEERDAVVVSHQNVRKNFTELRSDVDKLAAGLLSLGLQKGDRVGIWAPNMYEWVVAQFATARVGFILVNINPAYQAKELLYCLNKVEINTLIAADSFKSQNYYNILASAVPEVEGCLSQCISSKVTPSLKNIIMISENKYNGAFRYDDILNAGGSSENKIIYQMRDQVQMDDPVNIQFTSGTTGNPKAAILSHHNIVNNSYFVGRKLKYHLKCHKVCVTPPLYHCMGNVLGTMNILTNGICAVLPSPSFQAEESLKAIQNERCTSVYGTPTMFVDMLNNENFGNYKFPALKTGIMAGAPCPEALVKDVVKKMNAEEFIVVYGTTETSPVIVSCETDDTLTTKATTVGKAMDHVEVKIVDVNDQIVPIGTPGEMCARGYITMLGYWKDEVKTIEVLKPDGWYHTGDLMVMYENGYTQVVGRIKDMMIRGGENIYPREIEEFLHTHPKIAEAHVFGIPDKRLGEEICAWIKLRGDGVQLDESEVKAFCKGKISHFKIPRYVKFVPEFPTTITGKIQKFVMRAEMIKSLGL